MASPKLPKLLIDSCIISTVRFLIPFKLTEIMQKFFFSFQGITYIFNVIGWCLATAISLSTVYGPYKTGRKHFTSAENIMYGTLERFGWSLALAWVIFSCHRGLGGKYSFCFCQVNDLNNPFMSLVSSNSCYYSWLRAKLILFAAVRKMQMQNDQLASLLHVSKPP